MKSRKQAELIKSLTEKEIILSVIFTQVILLIIASILSPFFLKDWHSFLRFFQWDFKWVFIGVISGLVVVCIDLFLMNRLPQRFYDDGGINKKIFANLNFVQMIGLVLIVAIAEEWLFRGIIQTKFGLIPTSIIFSVIHMRYWTHWYLIVNIFVLSVWIGLVFEWSGQLLWPVIFMHFIIDFLLGISIRLNAKRKVGNEV
ncbi:membrane protease YdiL (CAAX protease family) [Lederbergia galactosidilyticus]|uniref:CPBP family intramembrane glutamic endopeptidase n=1 Tax=Lederbergia galactosidilytica TaxID=217031 RepID=UPI001AE8538B|nr:CPBP family intramembrane glutamic endopeptidase [Lederbergia galactosidilytica]MBP1914661.1 membrane protease YdiL (CAAX protease family) [Lederbergia galactosidilytica]